MPACHKSLVNIGRLLPHWILVCLLVNGLRNEDSDVAKEVHSVNGKNASSTSTSSLTCSVSEVYLLLVVSYCIVHLASWMIAAVV
jgi:hypothetical protein